VIPVPSSVELHDMTPALAEKVPQAKSHKFYLTAHAIVLVSASAGPSLFLYVAPHPP